MEELTHGDERKEPGRQHSIPANCLREFDPDRPDVTDSPFTVDAGHIQFDSSLATRSQGQTDKVS